MNTVEVVRCTATGISLMLDSLGYNDAAESISLGLDEVTKAVLAVEGYRILEDGRVTPVIPSGGVSDDSYDVLKEMLGADSGGTCEQDGNTTES